MLISSRNILTDTPRNTVSPHIWASWGSVKLVDKINQSSTMPFVLRREHAEELETSEQREWLWTNYMDRAGCSDPAILGKMEEAMEAIRFSQVILSPWKIAISYTSNVQSMNQWIIVSYLKANIESIFIQNNIEILWAVFYQWTGLSLPPQHSCPNCYYFIKYND